MRTCLRAAGCMHISHEAHGLCKQASRFSLHICLQPCMRVRSVRFAGQRCSLAEPMRNVLELHRSQVLCVAAGPKPSAAGAQGAT